MDARNFSNDELGVEEDGEGNRDPDPRYYKGLIQDIERHKTGLDRALRKLKEALNIRT